MSKLICAQLFYIIKIFLFSDTFIILFTAGIYRLSFGYNNSVQRLILIIPMNIIFYALVAARQVSQCNIKQETNLLATHTYPQNFNNKHINTSPIINKKSVMHNKC